MTRYYHIEDGIITELEAPVLSCWVNVCPPFEENELISLSDLRLRRASAANNQIGAPVGLLGRIDEDRGRRQALFENFLVNQGITILSSSPGQSLIRTTFKLHLESLQTSMTMSRYWKAMLKHIPSGQKLLMN